MNEESLIYEVKTGESLAEIAQRIGITDEQLINFHNSNCRDFGLPWFYNFLGIQKIVIPKNYKNTQQLWEEISKKLPSINVMAELFAEKYLISEIIERIGEEKIESKYLFKIDLKVDIKQTVESWVAKVQQFDFIKNGVKSDDKISNLNLACVEAILPILLKISDKGEIIGISEIQNLEAKFKEKRAEIEEFSIDKFTKQYLSNFQKSLSNEKFILQRIHSTLAYQLIFPKLDMFWKKEIFTKPIYILPNSFPVQCQFEPLHHINEDTNTITIEFYGEIIENCTLSELLQNIRYENEENENPLNGEMNLKYIYDYQHNKITNIVSEILLWNDEELYLRHQIDITQNENLD